VKILQISKHVHSLWLDFEIKLKDGTSVPRFVTSYIIESNKKIFLIDTALKNSSKTILEYIDSIGRNPEEIQGVINTHSHFDHIGGNLFFQEKYNPIFYAHHLEVPYIQDIELQHQERPVGEMIHNVGGPISIDKTIGEGDSLFLGDLEIQIFHTPGHSIGSISLFIPEDRVFICGDVLPEEGTLPIYENVNSTLSSLRKIERMDCIETLLSSLSRKVSKGEDVLKHIKSGENYLKKIQSLIDKLKNDNKNLIEITEITTMIFKELNLPKSGIIPIVLKSIQAHQN